MINQIDIKSLFGTYSYSLDITPEDNGRIRFLTGPNGYGKTSILRMLDAIYRFEVSELSNIPFEKFVLTFDDGYRAEVVQSRVYYPSDSDEIQGCMVDTNVQFYKGDKALMPNAFYSTTMLNDQPTALQLYFSSHPVYYITDKRLVSSTSTSRVRENADKMKYLLNHQDEIADFQDRLEAFKKIIESLEFSNKTLQVSPRYGYRFIANNEEKTILSADKLSSGEQHTLIMVYELLFEVPDDSLVLIDEPELSLHKSWQVDFLKYLKMITDLRDIQCIVSTHAPQIFETNWKLTVDLYEQSQEGRDGEE